MIEVRIGELADAETGAVMRPVATDFSAVTPAMRRLELEAGTVVVEQCRRLGELPLASAAITAAGDLAAEFMVHIAVRSRDEAVTAATVRQGLLNGLRRLEDWEIEDVAVAPIGTGAGNLDAEDVAATMTAVLAERLRNAEYPSRVVVVVDNEYERDAFLRAVAVAGLGEAEPEPGATPPSAERGTS